MRKTIFYLLILTFSFSYSQYIKREITIDGQGNVIDEKEIVDKENLKIKNPSEVLKEFYLNQNNIEIDKLISFRFYQKTPYIKFKEIMKSKFTVCGKFLNYKIVQTEYSDDKKSVRLNTDVSYENINTTEQIILIKEFDNDNFQVFDYNIKRK
ncbi:hypothetical protein [Formosa algae]|uniref:hypothetical protein n=1 Tax=Formosa algae TaxID=225843 RepID=UPI000CCF2FDA|nr:hypothetical protein [Formosa algae]PNW25763.1 hypothetical protein BKP44_19150 [Formosa algae]